MRKQSALVLLSVCTPLLLAAMVVDAAPLRWLAVLLIPALPVLLIAAAGERRLAAGGLLLLWLLLAGSLTALMVMSSIGDLAHPSTGDVIAVLGLMLFGLGVLPLCLVAWLFARSFPQRGLSPEDLRRLRGQDHR